MANALTTKARIKDRLQITETSYDDFFDRLILAVTARIERMCNRLFIQATYTNELYDGSDLYDARKCILIVKNAPMLSIASISYKTGLNSDPTWVAFTQDEYDVDMLAGILYFNFPLPPGKRNIRITYTAGYAGTILGIETGWVFGSVPDGDVDGSNLVYTLAEEADEVVAYADGLRIDPENYTFVEGSDTVTFDAGQAPFSTISVDYKPSTTEEDEDDPTLPLELVEVCERAVVRIFKRRNAEGRTTETLNESQITWDKNIFSEEDRATIKNYRRGSFL